MLNYRCQFEGIVGVVVGKLVVLEGDVDGCNPGHGHESVAVKIAPNFVLVVDYWTEESEYWVVAETH